MSCSAPAGFIEDGTDCDDYDADEFPGQTWYLDGDGDNYGDATKSLTQCERPTGYGAKPSDCDDTDPINPGAQEYCDGGIDNDCDGKIDNDDPSNAGDATRYYDGDGDGHGDLCDKTQCHSPRTTLSDDCDDTVAIVNPSVAEICNDVYDNDCDGTANSCGWQGEYTGADADHAFLVQTNTRTWVLRYPVWVILMTTARMTLSSHPTGRPYVPPQRIQHLLLWMWFAYLIGSDTIIEFPNGQLRSCGILW